MALKLYSGRTGDIKVYASDWKVFAREISKLEPEHKKFLKKRFREIGNKAKKGVVGELSGLGTSGPLSGMRHGGRTGWGTNYGSTGGPVPGAKRVPYNSVFVDSLTKAKRGQTGIARLRVRSAGTVLTDLARKRSGKTYTRPYYKRENGELIITTHAITEGGVNNFIRALGPVSKPSKRGKSRNVYPGFDKSYPAIKPEVEVAVNQAINLIESKLDRTGRR